MDEPRGRTGYYGACFVGNFHGSAMVGGQAQMEQAQLCVDELLLLTHVRRPNPQSYQLRQVNALASRNYELIATTKAKHRSAPDAECEDVGMCLPPKLQSRDLWSLGKGSTKRVMDIVFNVSIASFVWGSLDGCQISNRHEAAGFVVNVDQTPARLRFGPAPLASHLNYSILRSLYPKERRESVVTVQVFDLVVATWRPRDAMPVFPQKGRLHSPRTTVSNKSSNTIPVRLSFSCLRRACQTSILSGTGCSGSEAFLCIQTVKEATCLATLTRNPVSCPPGHSWPLCRVRNTVSYCAKYSVHADLGWPKRRVLISYQGTRIESHVYTAHL
ncbi:hypothetical protein VFPPC_15209 [Pochonia chlamydosporia 170]|uniref:Uncharacterized protein n=1 Tax=Pochonia chlamydosporia 170 TaxID=1380566 RepID=A0A179G4U5_METCM|nr:hypothetical protein VFPPC_15209 [Pochonia chlamydosporia 170]OAQ72876.1 hypothetical protein VFPPC_15209 [Pochonia chlamydosporia 170]